MTNEVVELFKRASELHENDRATLAGLLIESLESERELAVEAPWLDEVQQRLAELDSGAVKTVPWQNVRAKLLHLIDGS